jgi:multidrug efflux pump subunit AcrA (membrane-fusion protein)
VGELLCSISNTGMELKPNTTVSISIQLKERRNVLKVPRAAVQISGATRYAYVMEADRLRRREIKVGISNDTEFEVVDGLAENETIALPGDVPLQDGLAVRVDSPQ